VISPFVGPETRIPLPGLIPAMIKLGAIPDRTIDVPVELEDVERLEAGAETHVKLYGEDVENVDKNWF